LGVGGLLRLLSTDQEPKKEPEWREYVEDFEKKPREIPRVLLGRKRCVHRAFLWEQGGRLELRAYPISPARSLVISLFLAAFAVLEVDRENQESNRMTEGWDSKFGTGLQFEPFAPLWIAFLVFPLTLLVMAVFNEWEARGKARLRFDGESLVLSVFGVSWVVPRADLHAITEVAGVIKGRFRDSSVRQMGILWQMENGDFRMEPVLTVRKTNRSARVAQGLADAIGVPLMRPPTTGYLSNLDVAEPGEA
jgi:hypothetical protein